jgi:hypothetical protein
MIRGARPSEGELRRGEAATWGRPPSSDRPRMRLLTFKPFVKNSLRGFIDIELGIGLQITEASLHVSHGKVWVSLPSKPMLDADGRHLVRNGKKQYWPMLAWRDKRLADTFSKAVVALVIERHPGALDDDGAN